MHIKSIDPGQAAKTAAIMAFISLLMLTYPLAAAAWLFSVALPHKHFMILLLVPFFYALATYFLVAFGCMLFNFAARTTGGIRVEVVHAMRDRLDTVDGSAKERHASAA